MWNVKRLLLGSLPLTDFEQLKKCGFGVRYSHRTDCFSRSSAITPIHQQQPGGFMRPVEETQWVFKGFPDNDE